MSLVTTQAETVADMPEVNIRFCSLPQQAIDGILDQGYGFHHNRREPAVVRSVASFATTTKVVDELVNAVRRLAVVVIEEIRSKRALTQRSASGRRSEVACRGRAR